jgi:hypothetical protein
LSKQIKLRGVEEMQRNIKGITREFPGKVRRALYQELEINVMTRSKRDFVPVDEGQMRASGFVEMDKDPKRIAARFGFGGPSGSGNLGESNNEDVGYAIVQHEEPSYRHTVGSWKFLERPANEWIGVAAKNIADRVHLDKTGE